MKRTRVIETLAYHEAGHLVVAWQVGVRIKQISMLDAFASRGHEPPPPYFKLDLSIPPHWHTDENRAANTLDVRYQSPQRLENMALVCLAGPAAQRRSYPSGFRRADVAADYRQALAILNFLAAEPREAYAHLNLIDLRARNLVATDRIWRSVDILAEQLLDEVTLPVAAIRATIANSMGSLGGKRPR